MIPNEKENRVTVRLAPELGHRFRVVLAMEQVTAQAVMEKMISNYIALHDCGVIYDVTRTSSVGE